MDSDCKKQGQLNLSGSLQTSYFPSSAHNQVEMEYVLKLCTDSGYLQSLHQLAQMLDGESKKIQSYILRYNQNSEKWPYSK